MERDLRDIVHECRHNRAEKVNVHLKIDGTLE